MAFRCFERSPFPPLLKAEDRLLPVLEKANPTVLDLEKCCPFRSPSSRIRATTPHCLQIHSDASVLSVSVALTLLKLLALLSQSAGLNQQHLLYRGTALGLMS